jgi:hypothetical protein
MSIRDQFLKEWDNFVLAFTGAFDTPADRKKFADDPYAQDAVRRFKVLKDMVDQLRQAGKPAPFQPVGTVERYLSTASCIRWSGIPVEHGTELFVRLEDMLKATPNKE